MNNVKHKFAMLYKGITDHLTYGMFLHILSRSLMNRANILFMFGNEQHGLVQPMISKSKLVKCF